MFQELTPITTPYPVSREVFELSAGGLRAVGVYEEP
jgi:hypothetical protein